MAKKTAMPPIPPQSVEHLLLQDALARITEDKAHNILALMIGPGTKDRKRKKSVAQRKAEVDAVMDFSALGYAFYRWSKTQAEK